MDLIQSLVSQLGVQPTQAQAVAGTMLGAVEDTVREKLGGETASQLKSALPELGDWKQQAASLFSSDDKTSDSGGLLDALKSGNGGGGLLSAAMSALGGGSGGQIAAVAGLLGKLGIEGGKATIVANLVLQFLEKRLDKGLLDKILGAVPLLSGLLASSGDEAKSSGGGLAGALGGLLGR